MTGFLILTVVVSPLLAFAISLILRIAAEFQPETSWAGSRRLTLLTASNIMIAIGIFSLVGGFFISGPIALIPMIIAAVSFGPVFESEVRYRISKSKAQEAELLWILATASRSNKSLIDELESYANGTWGIRHRRLMKLAEHLRNNGLHSELAVPQGVFSRSVTLELQSGLHANSLGEVLRTIAERRTRDLISGEYDTDVKFSALYFAFMITTATLILGFLSYYILPKYVKIYDDFGTELPWVTRTLQSAGDSLILYGVLAIPALWLLLVGTISACFAGLYDWPTIWRLSVGRWFIRPHAPDVLKSLAATIEANSPLEHAFDPFVTSSVPLVLQRKSAAIRQELREGGATWRVLEKQGILDSNEVILCESAQAAGNLPWALRTLAESLERRLTYRISAMTELIRPIAVLLIGGVIGFVVVAMFMPIVKLLNDLS